MATEFIIYSREDRVAMGVVRRELTDSGHTVLTDENVPRTSDDWQQTIEEFIEGSDEIVVLLSPSAKRSPFVRREIQYAMTQGKLLSVILVAGEEGTAIPMPLATTQYEDRRQYFQ